MNLEVNAKIEHRILSVLEKHPRSAVHEIGTLYHEDSGYITQIRSNGPAISARLREMAYGCHYKGKLYYVKGETRPGTKLKEWRISEIVDIEEVKEPKEEVFQQGDLF